MSVRGSRDTALGALAATWIVLAAVAGQLAVVADARAAVAARDLSIAEGARFDLSPFSFSVTFAANVEMLDARLVDQDGKVTAIDLSYARTRASLFVLELPVLAPHAYRLHWRVREPGGAQTQGSVGFVVKGCDDPKLGVAR